MKNNNSTKKENLGKYFIAGTAVAAVLFVVFSFFNNEEPDSKPLETKHIWSQEGDSAFVKLCYEKYKPQVKDDIIKQETMKSFCRCMLEKIKTKYDEKDINKLRDEDIKQWDKECRMQIQNPGNINIK